MMDTDTARLSAGDSAGRMGQPLDLIPQVQALKAEGLSNGEIGARFGISKDAVFRLLKKAPEVVAPEPLVLDVDHIDDLAGLLAERGLKLADWIVVGVVVNKYEGFIKDAEGEAQKVPLRQLKVTLRPRLNVELLQPAEIKPLPKIPSRQPRKSDESRLFFIYGDDQRPNVDRGFESAKLAWVRKHQPDVIVDLGDGMDFPTVSGHKTNPAMNYSVKECIDDYGTWLFALRCAAPNAEIVILADNHVAGRLRDYQLARAAELYGVSPAQIVGMVDDLEPLISVRRFLRLDEMGITYVAPPGDTHYAESHYEIIPGELVALHGYRTGNNLGKKFIDDYGSSVIYGHAHQQDVYVTDQRRRGVGTRRRLTAIGVGCGGVVSGGGGFAPGADWQNGCLTVTTFPDGGWTWDYVNYEDGVMRWRDESYDGATT